jgi:mannose-1-phosphate guanylyltransferase/mannose-6-phosphate isomerase
MIVPVILAGGRGSRLWPVSRKNLPKQMLSLLENSTMLQSTILRLRQLGAQDPLVICSDNHRFMVADQLKQLDISASAILLEPCGKNTAPAAALAALEATKNNRDCILLILAADHFIGDTKAFIAAIKSGVVAAQEKKIVTFGVEPTKAETGFGYIKTTKKNALARVEDFVEKPSRARAEAYVDSGDYYWNSGIVMISAELYLEELARHRPKILRACQSSIIRAVNDLDFVRIDKKEFEQCPSESIDRAVLENAENIFVIPFDVGWSDIGSWSALKNLAASDNDQNVFLGDVLGVNTTASYVWAKNRLVVVIGLSDIVVVDTKDALLVASANEVHTVGDVVEILEESGRDESDFHHEVYRPWGKYEVIDSGEGYKVKRISVDVGGRLSVQRHQYRAEHWVVVEGEALVGKGEELLHLGKNESVYIPIKCVHWLKNVGGCPLELIEVQSGSYLGEDDIERLEDIYGRTHNERAKLGADL